MQDDWDVATQRRMASLVHLALNERKNIPFVEPIRAKFASFAYVPNFGSGIPEGVVDLLQQPSTKEWAALAIYACLPQSPQKTQLSLRGIDARHLMTPPGASAEFARALTTIRAIVGQAELAQCDADAESLLAAPANIFSQVLRKIYRGQRENDALEALVCRAAEVAIGKGLTRRKDLVQIIAELVSSRESGFKDSVRLETLRLPIDVLREVELSSV